MPADLTLTLLASLLALGAVVGFAAGLFGIGGGMLMVPVLAHLLAQHGVPTAMAVKMAIATAMATILFTSISSARAHHRRGAVRWPVVASMAPGVVVGGVLAGAGLFALLKGQVLALVFAAFVVFSATQMMLGRKPHAHRALPGLPGLAGAGAGVGLVSGLVGAGGGFLSVPFLIWCNVPVHQAVATGAALGLPVAAAATAGYVLGGWGLPAALPGAFGYLYLPALVAIACASVLTAPLGARTAHAMDVTALKRVFALLLYVLAASMVVKAVQA